VRQRRRLTYVGYTAVWETVARLPDGIAWRLPGWVGRAWHRFGPRQQRAQVRRNIARASGHPAESELDRLVAAAYRSYARYWVDAFRAHTLDPEEVAERSDGVNLDILDAVRDAGEGGILATGHIGSWDMGAFFSSLREWRLAAVAEVLEPRALFERFVRLRQDLGLEVIPLVRGGPMVRRLEKVIEDGGIATLLADRDLSGRGPVVDFFGEPCRLPPGPAALARRTGRPVVPGGEVGEATEARTLAEELGWPVLVKAAGGGARSGKYRVSLYTLLPRR
jgi:phosphatidylinositol dimannoside acyltransferase